MNHDDIDFLKLEKYDTKDVKDQHVNGSLTLVWRDYDQLLKFEPKMVYVTSANPGETKGPHLHKVRHSYFVCIRGKVIFVAKNKDFINFCKELSEINFSNKGDLQKINDSKMSNGSTVNDSLINLISKIVPLCESWTL